MSRLERPTGFAIRDANDGEVLGEVELFVSVDPAGTEPLSISDEASLAGLLSGSGVNPVPAYLGDLIQAWAPGRYAHRDAFSGYEFRHYRARALAQLEGCADASRSVVLSLSDWCLHWLAEQEPVRLRAAEVKLPPTYTDKWARVRPLPYQRMRTLQDQLIADGFDPDEAWHRAGRTVRLPNGAGGWMEVLPDVDGHRSAAVTLDINDKSVWEQPQTRTMMPASEWKALIVQAGGSASRAQAAADAARRARTRYLFPVGDVVQEVFCVARACRYRPPEMWAIVDRMLEAYRAIERAG